MEGSHCTYIKALVRVKEKLSMVLVLYLKNTVWKALHKDLNRGSRASSPNRPTLTSKQAGNFWIHYKRDFNTFFLYYYFLLIDLLSPLGCTPSFHLHMLHILSILMLFGEREVKRLYLEKTAWNNRFKCTFAMKSVHLIKTKKTNVSKGVLLNNKNNM